MLSRARKALASPRFLSWMVDRQSTAVCDSPSCRYGVNTSTDPTYGITYDTTGNVHATEWNQCGSRCPVGWGCSQCRFVQERLQQPTGNDEDVLHGGKPLHLTDYERSIVCFPGARNRGSVGSCAKSSPWCECDVPRFSHHEIPKFRTNHAPDVLRNAQRG